MSDAKPSQSLLVVEQILTDVVKYLGGESTALIIAADGKLILSTSGNEEKSARQAAMAAALLSLNESYSQEVLGNKTKEICISAATGNAVVSRVVLGRLSVILALSSDSSVNMAMLLRAAKDSAAKIQSSVQTR